MSPRWFPSPSVFPITSTRNFDGMIVFSISVLLSSFALSLMTSVERTNIPTARIHGWARKKGNSLPIKQTARVGKSGGRSVRMCCAYEMENGYESKRSTR